MNVEQEQPRQSFKIHRFNYYNCPGDQCDGSMFSECDGTATCRSCGLRAGDASQIVNAGSGDFDFIHAGPRGWQPAKVVADGLAGRKPDPANDPFAKALRRGVEARKVAAEEAETRAIDQRTAVAERQQEARDAKDEQRDFLSRRRATVAQKVARAQFLPE